MLVNKIISYLIIIEFAKEIVSKKFTLIEQGLCLTQFHISCMFPWYNNLRKCIVRDDHLPKNVIKEFIHMKSIFLAMQLYLNENQMFVYIVEIITLTVYS